jgi:hypothetical protein
MQRENAIWADIEKSQAEQRARHQAEITDLTANFQLQLKVLFFHLIIVHFLIYYFQQSLADLAANLSSTENFAPAKMSADVNSINFQPQSVK